MFHLCILERRVSEKKYIFIALPQNIYTLCRGNMWIHSIKMKWKDASLSSIFIEQMFQFNTKFDYKL